MEDILLGLCYAMVKSHKALIVRGLVEPVALSGGADERRRCEPARFAVKMGSSHARRASSSRQQARRSMPLLAAAGGGAATNALRGVLDHPRSQAGECPVWHRCRTAGTVPARLRRAAARYWERDP
ncbi:MAG: hypothetical protein ACLU0O_09455 [Collinsella sp.]